MNTADPFRAEVNTVGDSLSLVALGGLGLLVLVRVVGGAATAAFPYQRAGALFNPARGCSLPILARAAGPGTAVFGKACMGGSRPVIKGTR